MHCIVRYLLNFDLKIRSGQVWGQTYSAVEILQNFVAFSEYMNFNTGYESTLIFFVAFSEYMNFNTEYGST